jgi:ADP-ribose pyrophosphatase
MMEISRYIDFFNKYPEHFAYNENIEIIVDEAQLKEYADENKCKLGMVYENAYFFLIVDLIKNKQGHRYTYARIINRNKYNGVVIIPLLKDKIVFLKQFRHGTRNYEIELPRGFSEHEKTPEENAKIEIFEELGAVPKKINYLGEVVSDSGLTGGLVHIFTCEIDSIGKLASGEGIKDTVQLSLQDVMEHVQNNRIRDCFSLSAIYKLMISNNSEGTPICF